MTDERYIVMDVPHCLGHVIEECGEVLAAAGKTLRWGAQSYNPEPRASRETNKQWLLRELDDLESALRRLRFVLQLDDR